MTTLFPHPLLSAALVLMWLLLNQVSLGHLLLGTAVAFVAGQAMAALEPRRPRIRRPGLVVLLFLRVMADIITSNIAVARLILTGRRAGSRPGFVEIDLDLSDPTALAVLAVIITSTPGTAWLDYDAARKRLLLHVLDLEDEEEWRRTIRHRYAGPLKEIYE